MIGRFTIGQMKVGTPRFSYPKTLFETLFKTLSKNLLTAPRLNRKLATQIHNVRIILSRGNIRHADRHPDVKGGDPIDSQSTGGASGLS